jgi:hypothetical protein
MTRRRSRHSEERRQRLFIFLFKLSLVAAAFGLTAYYAYEAGSRVAQAEVRSLKEELQKATDSATSRQQRAESDQTALLQAQKQAEDFKTLYEQVKPTDEVRQLTALLHNKMAAGVDARRLEFVIGQAENPRGCKQLATKRFLVHTPRFKGPPAITLVSFDDNVTISAEGAGGNGGQEQWFDPERPVKIHLATQDGSKDADVAGKLPLEHALVIRDNEYHFRLTAGVRGWLDVATERCEFR